MHKPVVSIFWFRRDLRLEDNAALHHALTCGTPVQPLFIFDTCILDELEDRNDKRVLFIYQAVQKLQAVLTALGTTLEVRKGSPEKIFEQLTQTYSIDAVYTNNDYEPYARSRDNQLYSWLKEKGIILKGYKDQVIFEKKEIVKADGQPYTVYTPYANRWRSLLHTDHLKPYATTSLATHFYKQPPLPVPTLQDIGFSTTSVLLPADTVDDALIKNYHLQRDYPALSGTSRLGIHLRFGTLSIRTLAHKALQHNQKFLNELIWRDFYQMILFHFPQVVHQSFKKEYDTIAWVNNEQHFNAWCSGNTGYPLVDAGMRELNATGYMHNRVRMVAASFLTKHLLIDWRWGEAYFAKKLLDYDLAANNGGWQWAAGCGCDAAPYFRIFNPYLQQKKFDPENTYVHQWIPELASTAYPAPIVQHEAARAKCIAAYKLALKK